MNAKKVILISPLKISQIRVPPMLLKNIKGTSPFCGLSTGNIDHENYRKCVEYSINVEYSIYVEYPIYVTNIEYRTIPLSLNAFLDTNQVYQNLIIPLWLWHGLGYQAAFKSTTKSHKILVITKKAVFKSTRKSLKMLTKHHNNDDR